MGFYKDLVASIPLLSFKDKREDVNKDVNGKGTYERVTEIPLEDMDNYFAPLVDDIVANTVNPLTAFDRYVAYIESQKGYRDKQFLYMGDLAFRRRVVVHFKNFSRIRTTLTCIEIMFSMLGLTYTLTRAFSNCGFDIVPTFEDTIRRFDGCCYMCMTFSLDIAGPPLTPQLQAAIESVIAFNLPFNATLTEVLYNGAPIILGADFSADFNNFDFNAITN